MGVIAVCGVLVLFGLVVIARWNGRDLVVAVEDDGDARAALVARRFIRSVVLALTSGTVAGMLIAGPGGRLAMRLLAATAGDAAQGRVTEADEVVGRITVGGSIGFILFNGLFFGIASGVLFMIVRRWLPGGHLRGVAFGGLLLVALAPVLDPLRRENPDFDVVGPGWLSVVVFGALVVAHAMVVAAVAGRYSEGLPLISLDQRSLVRHLPLLILVPAAPAFVGLAVAGLVVVGLSQVPPVNSAFRSARATLAGRLVLGAVALLSLPSFVAAVIDIAGRGPA